MAIDPTRSEERIIDAAVVALTEDPDASLSKIALKAGVGRATLHRHFATREILVEAVISRCVSGTTAAMRLANSESLAGLERLARLLEVIIPRADRFKFITTYAQTSEAMAESCEEELKIFESLVEALREEGLIRESIPASWAAATVSNLMWQAWYEVGVGNIGKNQAAELVLDTLLQGIGKA